METLTHLFSFRIGFFSFLLGSFSSLYCILFLGLHGLHLLLNRLHCVRVVVTSVVSHKMKCMIGWCEVFGVTGEANSQELISERSNRECK